MNALGPAPSPLVRSWTALRRLGPWLAMAVAIGFSIWMPLPPERTREVELRHARIKSVFERVPLRMGEWVGEEAPLTPSAVELLRPNAAISRTYRRLGLPGTYNFSLIHCSDFRDMGGHYPPVCYPAHGWSLAEERRVNTDVWVLGSEPEAGQADSRETPTLEVPELANSGPAELAIYRFARSGAELREIRMTVVSAFVLPDGRWTRALGDVRDSAGRRRVAAEGVAQVQLALAGWPPLESIEGPVSSLLTSIPKSVWRSLGIEPSTEAGSP